MIAELLSQRISGDIVTLYRAHPGRSVTSLKTIPTGTNVYVCVCPIKILARWQHDKMVSISKRAQEDEYLRIIVACQKFKMGYFL